MFLRRSLLCIFALCRLFLCLKAYWLGTGKLRSLHRSTSPDQDTNQPPIIPFEQGADFVRPPAGRKVVSQTAVQTNKVNAGDNAEVPKSSGFEQSEAGRGMSDRLRDASIGAEKDSAERKQARFIVRSITVISITIGIIFTSIWYLFPGQFISYRGATQPQDAVDVVQPEDSDNNPL